MVPLHNVVQCSDPKFWNPDVYAELDRVRLHGMYLDSADCPHNCTLFELGQYALGISSHFLTRHKNSWSFNVHHTSVICQITP